MTKRKQQIFYKCVQILNNMNQSQKSHPEKDTKTQIDGFFWLSSNFLTHIIVRKSARKTKKKNQQWPSPHAAEIEGKGVNTSFHYFFHCKRSEKLKKKWNPGSEKASEAHVNISMIIFQNDSKKLNQESFGSNTSVIET